VHLNLENLKRFGLPAHTPILIHDDRSGCSFHAIQNQYDCDLSSNYVRYGHQLGDLTVFAAGLEWARWRRLKFLIKISRRFLVFYDIVSDFLSQCPGEHDVMGRRGGWFK